MRGDLILLHGFTQTGRSWAPVVAELGERYRAFAPDLPGHGDAAERRPASFGAVTAYLRALREERFTLVGYSMGGRLALAAALALGPERVERLVLVSASPGLADATQRQDRRTADEVLALRIEEIGVERFAAEWAAQPLFEGMPRGVADIAHADRLRNTAAGLATALRGMGTGVMEPLWERLGELAIPVVLLAGERDEKFAAIAGRMAGAIGSAEVVVVAGAGHALHLERPDAVAGTLA